jgi:hypothetical protein
MTDILSEHAIGRARQDHRYFPMPGNLAFTLALTLAFSALDPCCATLLKAALA